MSFDSLGLRPELLRALRDAGYTVPTPVQAEAIPVILEGRDIVAGAQTGTGKTAAFTIPLLQRLWDTPNRQRPHARQVRALVLTPTRELAAQVEESVRRYGKYMPMSSTTVFGGVNMNPQVYALMRGVDILVATPGRLLDHVNQRTVDLSKVEILVLDEADRMLDMGFIKDIRTIISLIPANRQSLLFSATFSDDIKRLTDTLLKEPVLVEVARNNAESDLVTQSFLFSSNANKQDLLIHLLVQENIKQALIFVRTKHGADRLSVHLQRDGVSAVAIHGNLSQMQRMRALSDFKTGRVRILVATDIAARGLDIEQLPHVINYDLPHTPEDYIHRIGRTGRAGVTGEAISLVSSEERNVLYGIERLIKKRLEQRQAVGFTPAVPENFSNERQSGVSRQSKSRQKRQQSPFAFHPRETSRPGAQPAGNDSRNQKPAAQYQSADRGHASVSMPRKPKPLSSAPAHSSHAVEGSREQRRKVQFSQKGD